MPVRLETQPIISDHAMQRLRERVLPLLRARPEWDHREGEDLQLRAWADATLEGAVITPTTTGAWQATRRVTNHTMAALLLVRSNETRPWVVVTVRVLGAADPADNRSRAKRTGRYARRF